MTVRFFSQRRMCDVDVQQNKTNTQVEISHGNYTKAASAWSFDSQSLSNGATLRTCSQFRGLWLITGVMFEHELYIVASDLPPCKPSRRRNPAYRCENCPECIKNTESVWLRWIYWTFKALTNDCIFNKYINWLAASLVSNCIYQL
jgi:hypothetical protein